MRMLRNGLAALGAAVALDSLAQAPATPQAFTRSDKGHCIACHQLPDSLGIGSRADLGPRLEGPRMRELGKARIRALINDPTLANPDTVMPPFGRHRILEAAEIEALVDYLHALP